MTFDAEPVATPSPAPILWITGLSGAGKTTLANAVVGALRGEGLRPLLLDGDGVREALESDGMASVHTPAMRAMRAWRMARMARMAALQGVPVVVATISLLHAVQAWNRAGTAPYGEVLLLAELAELRQRKPELYGVAQDVVGLDIVPEFPLCPEAVLRQSFGPSDLASHCAAVLQLWRRLASAEGTAR